MLPLSTARPPSLREGMLDRRGSRRSRGRDRARPSARSWLKATWVGTPPGAAREEVAHALAVGAADVPAVERVAQVAACTVGSRVSSRPARSSSPRIAMMPPARCTSSMCTSRLGRRDLAEQGTRRDSAVDVVHGEVDPALVGGGQDVQHGVGRAAHGDVERHGVLERGLGGDRCAAARSRRPARSSGGRDRRSGGRPRRTGACGRRGSPGSSRCRAATGRAPRSGSSSSWR